MDAHRGAAPLPASSFKEPLLQMVAGAVLADADMDVFGIDELTICPWALREGVLLERLDQM